MQYIGITYHSQHTTQVHSEAAQLDNRAHLDLWALDLLDQSDLRVPDYQVGKIYLLNAFFFNLLLFFVHRPPWTKRSSWTIWKRTGRPERTSRTAEPITRGSTRPTR